MVGVLMLWIRSSLLKTYEQKHIRSVNHKANIPNGSAEGQAERGWYCLSQIAIPEVWAADLAHSRPNGLHYHAIACLSKAHSIGAPGLAGGVSKPSPDNVWKLI